VGHGELEAKARIIAYNLKTALACEDLPNAAICYTQTLPFTINEAQLFQLFEYHKFIFLYIRYL
jgi:hypothetical protein